MIQFRCDLCVKPCDGVTTRRWQHIFGEIGLEVVVLRGYKPVGDCNICDDCILRMFWVMLERAPNSALRKKQENTLAREAACWAKENELESRESALKALLDEIKEKEDNLAPKDQLQVQNKELSEEIAKVKLESEAIKSREKELIRQAEARGFQAAVDKFEYPEYVWQMANRKR